MGVLEAATALATNERRRIDAVSVFRMYGVDKEYDGSVIVRIDNDGGTRVAGMPIGIRTKQISIVGGIGCKIIPTESASQTGGSAWHSTHGFYTQRTQDASVLFHSPPFCRAAQSMAISSAQENTPALPLIPPFMTRASGS